jgi:hypothetical protein
MKRPEFEQFGVTREECNSIYEKKIRLRDYTFGIASAVGILTGCIIGVSMAEGLYETVLFFLFFGCFLGSLFGALFTIVFAKLLYTLFLQITSPSYRGCRRYLNAKSKAAKVEYKDVSGV